MVKDKKLRCRKCKGMRLSISEIVIVPWNYEFYDNKFFSLGEGNSSAEYIKLNAYCEKCNYSWTFKGMTTIEELKEKYDLIQEE